MARKPQSRGKCNFCGREMTKGGLSRHLRSCSERQEALAEANQKSSKSQEIYHLQAQDDWSGDFWLHLEMNGSATLKDLDHYLRAIWLECCGHLSQFSVGGWSGNEIPMGRKIQQVFGPDVELTHIYDFGTESVTRIKYVDARRGAPLSKHPIFLMARNNRPEAECMECDKQAEWLCMECVYEDEESGFLCDEHVQGHPHDEYGEPFPLVNSPRVGLCGYSGPAEPPY